MNLNLWAMVHQNYGKTAPSNALDPQADIPSFDNIIRDSELLISYAAIVGTTLNDHDVTILSNSIRTTRNSVKTPEVSDNPGIEYADVLISYSKVAKQLLPVTAFGLRRFFTSYYNTLKFYVGWGVSLAILVVLSSLIIFVSTSISDSIKTEIDLANSKAITLRARFGNTLNNVDINSANNKKPVAPVSDNRIVSATYSEQDMLIDLQQLAISSRAIDGRAMQLRHLIFAGIPDPFKGIRRDREKMSGNFELDPTLADPRADFVRIVGTYQSVRAYAQSLRDGVVFWYGGVAASVLPVLYAILGVCAWSLRRMQVAIRDKTFTDPGAKEQMLVAVIAGMLISLFNGLFSSSVSLSPLAWAFLAGYSSDAFFQVLDGVVRLRAPIAATTPPVSDHATA